MSQGQPGSRESRRDLQRWRSGAGARRIAGRPARRYRRITFHTAPPARQLSLAPGGARSLGGLPSDGRLLLGSVQPLAHLVADPRLEASLATPPPERIHLLARFGTG